MYRNENDPAIDYLKSVYGWKLEIQRCQDRIKSLEDQAVNVTSNLSGMPRGGNADSQMVLAVLADETKAYSTRLRDAELAKREVEQFIEGIADPIYRAILSYRYVDCLRWPAILNRLQSCGANFEERQMFNIHGRALNAARARWEETHENVQV